MIFGISASSVSRFSRQRGGSLRRSSDCRKKARRESSGTSAANRSITVDGDEEAIALANDSEFGLMAYVYSRDIGRVVRAAERLESGMVAVNTGVVSNPAAPFGGVKASGLGREGSHEGLDEYLETKYLGISLE